MYLAKVDPLAFLFRYVLEPIFSCKLFADRIKPTLSRELFFYYYFIITSSRYRFDLSNYMDQKEFRNLYPFDMVKCH